MSNNNAVLAEERFRRIRSFLKQRGSATVDELCVELGVSGATVRRDLCELDMRSQVRRVHGGAVSIEASLEEPVFDDKALIAASEKQAIAQATLQLIKPNDSIFLDGGSSVLALARLLVDMSKLTVVTNSFRVASILSAAGPRMILVGGEFRRISQTFVGPMTRPHIDQIFVEKAFMGTIGLKGGDLTTTDPAEAMTKELIMKHARKVYLLADSTKFEQVSFVKFGELNKGITLVMDDNIGQAGKDLISERQVELIKA